LIFLNLGLLSVRKACLSAFAAPNFGVIETGNGPDDWPAEGDWVTGGDVGHHLTSRLTTARHLALQLAMLTVGELP
jgi:hypothetical protein